MLGIKFDDKAYRNIYVIGDVHGEYESLTKLEALLKQNGMDLTQDLLIQLGDRPDRGPDSYKVNEFFKTQQLMYPKNVIVINGNHDRFMLSAADGNSDLMWFNGGNKTEKSYSGVSKIYGKNGFGNSVRKAGHYDWLKNLPLFAESENYFFSHAPIPKSQYLSTDRDIRSDEHTLTWSFVMGVPETEWIDPNPVLKDYGDEAKLCVSGHIHSGIYHKTGDTYYTPNPRRIGNQILIDTGSGCWKGAKLCAVELRSLKYYLSDGTIGQL